MARRRAWLAAVAAAGAACASSPAAPPSPPAPAAAPAQAAAHGSYGPEPQAAPSPLESAALQAARERVGAGRPLPRPSAALQLAARTLARGAADGVADPLARWRLRAALAAALAFDGAPAAHLVVAAADDATAALAAALSPSPDATHVGVGAELRGGRAYVVALVARRRAALEPFPREVAPGATATLRGELAGLDHASVHVTTPSGRSERVDAARQGRRFAAQVRFAAAGRWLVEVMGEGPRGPEVAALLVVSCGGAALAEPDAAPEGSAATEPRQAEAQVAEAIDEARRRHGLPALERWPALADVARRHSEAMAAAGVLAHRLPGSDGAGERLRRGRLPFARVLENVARGPTALAAHRVAEESPAHRENILAGGVTRLGCGVARGTLAGEAVVYVTELFVEPVEDGAADRLTPEARVREALWRERARIGAEPLASDPVLDVLARDAARQMLRHGEPDAQALAARALREGRKSAAADAFVAARAAEAVRSKNVGDRGFRRVGVGVAIGDDPKLGAGLLWIAVVYTD